MDEVIHSNRKTFGKRNESVKTGEAEHPVKRIHLLDGKYFIIIDRSIAEDLKFVDTDNTELYFRQEVTDDGCIILSPFRIRD